MLSGHRCVTRRTILGSMLVAPAVWTLGSGRAPAQDPYPSRPVEFIVPWGPGGGADQLARMSGKLVEPILRQSLPVLNVPGGTGATGMAKLMASPADGHSIAIYIADSHALLVGGDARWTMADISPIAVMLQAPSFLFVSQKSRFKDWAEFEAEAKANPGKLKVATLGFGSVDDFTLKALDRKGVRVNQVPYAKPSDRYVSILGGHADALYEQAGDVAQFLKGKQIRPILVFGTERFPSFQDVPSSKEFGYDVSLPQFRAIVARAGTPAERIKTLSEAFSKAAASPEYKQFLKDQFASESSFIDGPEAAGYLSAQLEEMKSAAT